MCKRTIVLSPPDILRYSGWVTLLFVGCVNLKAYLTHDWSSTGIETMSLVGAGLGVAGGIKILFWVEKKWLTVSKG